MSQEARAVLFDKHRTEISIRKVVRVMQHGEFIPAKAVLLQAVARR